MTDLKNGIIEIDGFLITPNTTKKDIMNVLRDKLSPLSTNSMLDFNKLFNIDDNEFMIVVWLDNRECINRIELTPRIEYRSEKWDRTGKQEERREFCDKWLFKRLGEPHYLSEKVTRYTFKKIEIYSLSHFDIRNGADAGYIVLEYLN